MSKVTIGLKSIYLFHNIFAGVIIGIVAPIMVVSHLAQKTNRYFLNLVLGLAIILLLSQLFIALFKSITVGVIVYFIPWVVFSIINDFSLLDRDDESEKELEDADVEQ